MKKLVSLASVALSLLLLLWPLKASAATLPPRLNIDSPASNSAVATNTNTVVSGWALNSSGIREVDIRIDYGTYKRAAFGQPRSDVARAYSGYPGASTSGYSYTIASGTLKAGTHTITVKAIGKNGTVQTLSRTVQAKVLNPLMSLDGFVAGQKFTVNSAITFRGWALNASGIRSVYVTVDNLQHTAAVGISRPDVARVYGLYPGAANSGYSYTLPANTLGAGSHTVRITAYGNNGSSRQVSSTFTTVIPSPVTHIDTPANGYISGDNRDIKVSGWAVNWSGVKKIDFYIDNASTPAATAGTGLPRSDVAKAYPGYPNVDTAGYTTTLPLSGFCNGTHTVKAVAVGNNGTTSTFTRTIGVQKYQMSLDAAGLPQYLSDTLGFTGWAVNASAVKAVNLYADGSLLASATVGQARDDVAALYGAYPNAETSGFAFDGINIKGLAAGRHTFRVDAVGNDNTLQSQSFTAVKQAPVTVIQSPASNISTGGTVTVSGYALNATGLAGVSASVDGGAALPAAIVDNSSPVGKYSGYKGIGSSGFTVDVNIANYSTGKHTVTVTATGADGGKATASVIVYNRGVITYTSYGYSLSSLQTKQLSSGPGPGYSYNGWKYIRTAQNGYYYFKSNSTGGTTYTWVSEASPYTIYNTIHSQFIKYSNPANLVNDSSDIYQFMKLSYVDGVSVAGLNSFFNPDGVLKGMGQAFIDAGKKYNVSPVYLAMHAIEETGNGTSALARGIYVKAGTYNIAGTNYTVACSGTYYNLFGIHADDGSVSAHGSQYAGYKGWDSVQKAIDGGACWIALNYTDTYGMTGVGYNQDTLYKMRWNPDRPGTYQYATDILWAHNSAALIKQYYDKYASAALTFDVPKYTS